MANIKTQQRVEVELSLDADEAKALSAHLNATVDENTPSTVQSIAQNLDRAVNGKPKQEGGAKRGPKPKNQDAQPATSAAPAAAAQPQAQPTQPKPAANGTPKPAAAPAAVPVKEKVKVQA